MSEGSNSILPEECRDVIVENILHYDQRLRLSSLHLLAGSPPSESGPEDMLAKLLEAETIPLTMHGVRDRLLKIQRLNLSVKSEGDARLASLWLLGPS